MGFFKAVQSGLSSFISEFASSPKPANGVGSVLVSPSDHGPRYPKAAFWPLLQQGFESNPIIYSGLMYLARSIAGSPMRTMGEDGAPVQVDRLRELLVRTNVRDDELELLVLITLYKACAGNAYWHKVRGGGGQVVELWPLRPDRVALIPDYDKVIGAYVYTVAGERFIVAPEDMLHFRALRTSDDYFGFAPLAAAKRAIGTDNEASDYANALLRNSAIPGVVVTTETLLNKTKSNRLRAMWLKKYGKDRRGEPAFLQKGMDVKLIGLDLQKLAFGELTDTQEARMLGVLGIPPILVGAQAGLKRSTYANYAEARAAFWETTADWWQKEFATAVAHDPDFRPPPKFTIAFDNSRTPAFEAKQSAAWERAVKATGGTPICSVNEARAMVGLPKSTKPEHDEIPDRPEPAALGAGEDPPARGAKHVLRLEHAVAAALPAPRRKSDLDNLDDSTGRVRKAEKYREQLAKAARELFVIQAEDTTAIFTTHSSGNEFTAQLEAAIASDVEGRVQAWSRVANEKFHPIIEEVMGQSVQDTATTHGLDITVDRPQVRSFVDDYAFKFAEKTSATSAEDVRQVLIEGQKNGSTVDEVAAALKEKFKGWSDARAQMVAQTETIRSANRGAQLAYREAGIERKRWLASGDACKVCLAMNGRVMSIDEPFLAKGQEFNPVDDAGKAILSTPFSTKYEDIETPPMHPNCRCTVVADV